MNQNQNSKSATGSRKEAAARVWLLEGTGKIVVNGRPALEYFCRPVLVKHIEQPLVVTNMLGKVDIKARAKGGGLTGQAGAVRHAIARALCKLDPQLRGVLKRGGFLTRDPRVVERKKYGRPGARKRYQYSKR